MAVVLHRVSSGELGRGQSRQGSRGKMGKFWRGQSWQSCQGT